MIKNPPANAGDVGSIPGLERSPGEGNGNPLQYPCLENSWRISWTEEPGGLWSIGSQRVSNDLEYTDTADIKIILTHSYSFNIPHT